VNKSCKFCASVSYGSEDIGRQIWSQKIWAKNEAEKKLSPKNVNGSKKVSAKRKSLNFGTVTKEHKLYKISNTRKFIFHVTRLNIFLIFKI